MKGYNEAIDIYNSKRQNNPLFGSIGLADYLIQSDHTSILAKHLDVDVIDLILGMLEFNPAKRLTAKQCLEHKFFTNHPVPCHPSELP